MREQVGAESEVDYLLPHDAQVLPIEVKAGASGSLKSLHIFMSQRRLPRAIRDLDTECGERRVRQGILGT
jgi:uncharacterized protein